MNVKRLTEYTTNYWPHRNCYHHNYWYISVIIFSEFWVREGDNRVPERMGQREGYPSASWQVLGISPGGFLLWQIVAPLGRSNWTCCGPYSLWEQGTLMWASVYHSPESPHLRVPRVGSSGHSQALGQSGYQGSWQDQIFWSALLMHDQEPIR